MKAHVLENSFGIENIQLRERELADLDSFEIRIA
jgi:hypothetical protein